MDITRKCHVDNCNCTFCQVVGILILLKYHTVSAPSMFTSFRVVVVFCVRIFAFGSSPGGRYGPNCGTTITRRRIMMPQTSDVTKGF